MPLGAHEENYDAPNKSSKDWQSVFSKILPTTGMTENRRKLPGSSLPPPLWTGDTLQYFHADRIKLVSKDLLKIRFSGSAIP